MAEIKNSHGAIQTSQNQVPISFQLSMETIITFCSIWAFFGYKWAMGPGSNIKRSQLSLAPLFQKPLILSDHFLTLDLFSSATPKGWKEIYLDFWIRTSIPLDFQISNFMLNLLGKSSLKKIEYSRSTLP